MGNSEESNTRGRVSSDADTSFREKWKNVTTAVAEVAVLISLHHKFNQNSSTFEEMQHGFTVIL